MDSLCSHLSVASSEEIDAVIKDDAGIKNNAEINNNAIINPTGENSLKVFIKSAAQKSANSECSQGWRNFLVPEVKYLATISIANSMTRASISLMLRGLEGRNLGSMSFPDSVLHTKILDLTLTFGRVSLPPQ